MLKDGLVYSESRMGYEQEFMEDLAAFELKSSCGTFQGGPVLFRKNDICYTDHSDSHDLIVGDTEANTHAVSALKTLLAGKHSDKNGFRIYIGEKGDKAIRKFARQIPNHKEGYYLAINDKEIVLALSLIHI